jgi:hypothetical protein
MLYLGSPVWKRFLLELKTIKLSVQSPPTSSALAPILSFSGIRKVIFYLLNLGMKCWNSALNARGSRVIIAVVQVGAVKIYVAAVQVPRKKETQYETQFTTKIGEKPSLGPSYFLL